MEELTVKCNGVPMMFVTKLHPTSIRFWQSHLETNLKGSKREKENNRRLEICDRSQEGIAQRQKKNILRLPDWIGYVS